MQKLYQGDCLDWLNKNRHLYDCGFADPPDNLGLKYDGLTDNMPEHAYYRWMGMLIERMLPAFKVSWLSIYHKHLRKVLEIIPDKYVVRIYVWRFRFGQYTEHDSPNGYRPILRINHSDWKPILTERVMSVREEMGDLRATGVGKIPDDVWDFPRIQGNNKERRNWHPTQHPEAIYQRIEQMSVRGTFVDLFAGTGTAFRACSCDVIGIEQSETYCEEIANEHNLEIERI